MRLVHYPVRRYCAVLAICVASVLSTTQALALNDADLQPAVDCTQAQAAQAWIAQGEKQLAKNLYSEATIIDSNGDGRRDVINITEDWGAGQTGDRMIDFLLASDSGFKVVAGDTGCTTEAEWYAYSLMQGGSPYLFRAVAHPGCHDTYVTRYNPETVRSGVRS